MYTQTRQAWGENLLHPNVIRRNFSESTMKILPAYVENGKYSFHDSTTHSSDMDGCYESKPNVNQMCCGCVATYRDLKGYPGYVFDSVTIPHGILNLSWMDFQFQTIKPVIGVQ